MNVTELLSKINKNESEYSLGDSDFARTISNPSNGIVAIQLMQRNTVYNECIVVGNQNISSGTKGIVLFVSKAKYPCFIPIYFSNDSFISVPDGSVSIKTVKPSNEQDYPQTNFVNLEDVIKSSGLSEGVHYTLRLSDSPYADHWGTVETINSIIKIFKVYFEHTKGKIILNAGDIAQVNGGKYQKHEGRGHATGRGIDMHLSNGLQEASRITQDNKQIIIDLFDIFLANGVWGVMWFPPVWFRKELRDRYGERIRIDKNHSRHFHVSFISLPF
jgi:hypothetical protein